MTAKITSERLKIVIHSLKRPGGGGIDKFIEAHSEELGELLEKFVLPKIQANEQLMSELRTHKLYDDDDDENVSRV